MRNANWIVKELKNTNRIRWPPQSPYWNPIENLWWDIKKALKTNRNELEMNVRQYREEIAVERCERLGKMKDLAIKHKTQKCQKLASFKG